jgi:hypothetical protein
MQRKPQKKKAGFKQRRMLRGVRAARACGGVFQVAPLLCAVHSPSLSLVHEHEFTTASLPFVFHGTVADLLRHHGEDTPPGSREPGGCTPQPCAASGARTGDIVCCMVPWRARGRGAGARWEGPTDALRLVCAQVNTNARFCPHDALQPLRQCCCGFFDIAVGFRCAPAPPLRACARAEPFRPKAQLSVAPAERKLGARGARGGATPERRAGRAPASGGRPCWRPGVCVARCRAALAPARLSLRLCTGRGAWDGVQTRLHCMQRVAVFGSTDDLRGGSVHPLAVQAPRGCLHASLRACCARSQRGWCGAVPASAPRCHARSASVPALHFPWSRRTF